MFANEILKDAEGVLKAVPQLLVHTKHDVNLLMINDNRKHSFCWTKNRRWFFFLFDFLIPYCYYKIWINVDHFFPYIKLFDK